MVLHATPAHGTSHPTIAFPGDTDGGESHTHGQLQQELQQWVSQTRLHGQSGLTEYNDKPPTPSSSTPQPLNPV